MSDEWLEAPARAKVNLALRIFPRGSDGYHPLETLFCRIDLADRLQLRLRPEGGVLLNLLGPEWAPQGEQNLAARAASLFLQRASARVGVEIRLEKRIPAGAGLGGASSDAATVLRLLAQRVALPGGAPEVLRLASELGADVPFLAADVPFAFAWARGHRLLSLPPLPARPFLLVLPGIEVSTAEAYASWDREIGERRGGAAEPVVRRWSELQRWEDLKALAVNDFEPVVFARHPALREVRDILQATFPVISLLTGSGAALFGVYESQRERDAAAARLEIELRGVSGELGGVKIVSACGPV
ncbi:MAG: 4-(cytidine 5'-diphospho)-2-C-methyl-D-erythritol kinase [Gemmatimonadota bacterium]|nr:MAG: 4-(cytidine 5'-diphospho)-2-C-methyl-D-erythritol kinase [Gemmatimonadota bacterium]